MSVVATVFGWSVETWTVIAALLAVAVALASFIVAWRSHGTAKRAADQAKRSASAAERSADLQSEALAIEKNRDQRERLEAVKSLGPEWEAVEPGEAGCFSSTTDQMRGRLRNSGLMVATVHDAYFDFDGQRAAVRTRCDGAQGGGGWASTVHVPPQSVLELECDLQGITLRGDARPSLYLDFEQPGTETGMHGVTVEFLRTGTTASGDAAWRVGRVRRGLLP